MASQVDNTQVNQVDDKPTIKYTSVCVKRSPTDDFKGFMNKIGELKKQFTLSYLNFPTCTYLRFPLEHKNTVYNSGLRFTGTKFVMKATYTCDKVTADSLNVKENRHTFVKTRYNEESGELEFTTCLRQFALVKIVRGMFERVNSHFDENSYHTVHHSQHQGDREEDHNEDHKEGSHETERHDRTKQQFRRVSARNGTYSNSRGGVNHRGRGRGRQ